MIKQFVISTATFCLLGISGLAFATTGSDYVSVTNTKLDTNIITIRPISQELPRTVYIDNQVITLDVTPQTINGITMLPVKQILETYGYNVKWDPSNQVIEIYKGAQWTSLKIGANSYTTMRMASFSLSAAPMIESGRTLVPAEFFKAVLDLDLRIENRNIYFSSQSTLISPVIRKGYIKKMTSDETGAISITLTTDLSSDDTNDLTIIHTSNAYTIYNHPLKEGDYIKALTAPTVTMSYPEQTSAYIIY